MPRLVDTTCAYSAKSRRRTMPTSSRCGWPRSSTRGFAYPRSPAALLLTARSSAASRPVGADPRNRRKRRHRCLWRSAAASSSARGPSASTSSPASSRRRPTAASTSFVCTTRSTTSPTSARRPRRSPPPTESSTRASSTAPAVRARPRPSPSEPAPGRRRPRPPHDPWLLHPRRAAEPWTPSARPLCGLYCQGAGGGPAAAIEAVRRRRPDRHCLPSRAHVQRVPESVARARLVDFDTGVEMRSGASG